MSTCDLAGERREHEGRARTVRHANILVTPDICGRAITHAKLATAESSVRGVAPPAKEP
jgi:hypothetical protein